MPGVLTARAIMAAQEEADQLEAKLRRTLELVYGVEGVVAARVWQWAGGVAVGVRGSSTTAPEDLLRRVEKAVAGLRDADEAWEFGILDEGRS
jgi:hypothetical protein